MILKYVYLILFVFVSFSLWSQTEEKIRLNEGVDLYKEGDFTAAQERFEKAYENNPSYTRALYNAGNAAYFQGNFDNAKVFYNDYAKATQNPNEIAKAHFNIGNANMQIAKKTEQNPEKAKDAQAYYKEAINSYKQSLKYNPNDQETKYNLTYALKKLKQNQQNQDQNKNQDENKEENQDENQDKQDEKDQNDNSDGENDSEKNDDKEGDKNDNQKNNESEGDNKEEKENDSKNGNQDPKDEKEQEGQISKAQAIKDLDAINNDENKTLQKVYQKNSDKKGKANSDKDW